MSHALPPEFTDLLVVQAHPDDAEHGVAGSVARWCAEGRRVHYLLCTSGDKGSRDPEARPADVARTREAEQREAARRLGLASVRFLGRHDGELEVSLTFRAEITAVIRAVRPQLVATFDPWRLYQLHPDHRAVGLTTLDAVMAARDPLYFPEQRRDGLAAHRVREVWLWSSDHADVVVDISATIDRKLAALQAHACQLGDWEARAARIRERARVAGLPHGVPFAETFKRLEMPT